MFNQFPYCMSDCRLNSVPATSCIRDTNRERISNSFRCKQLAESNNCVSRQDSLSTSIREATEALNSTANSQLEHGEKGLSTAKKRNMSPVACSFLNCVILGRCSNQSGTILVLRRKLWRHFRCIWTAVRLFATQYRHFSEEQNITLEVYSGLSRRLHFFQSSMNQSYEKFLIVFILLAHKWDMSDGRIVERAVGYCTCN